MGLVPRPGTQLTPHLGLPVSDAQPLGYYAPSGAAEYGDGIGDLAEQLSGILESAVESDFHRWEEEMRAVRSQRSRIAQSMAQVRALAAAHRGQSSASAIALAQEKKQLASEAQALAELAGEAGFDVEGVF